MNQSIHFNFDPAKIVASLKRYRNMIIGFIVMALVGYTGYQLSRIPAAGADQAYLNTLEDKQSTVSLKGNQKVLQQLTQLQSSGDTTIPVTLGKNDPFSL